MIKKYLSEKEAEEYTGFHRNKLREFRLQGTSRGIKLPFSIVNRSVRYKISEIDKFIDKHQITQHDITGN
jgi:hypothetical protein